MKTIKQQNRVTAGIFTGCFFCTFLKEKATEGGFDGLNTLTTMCQVLDTYRLMNLDAV